MFTFSDPIQLVDVKNHTIFLLSLTISLTLMVSLLSLLVMQTARAEFILATVNVGRSPDGVTYDSGRGEVFVANTLSNNLSVISDSANKVVATVDVGNTPADVVYDSGRGEVFVVDGVTGTVSVIHDSQIPLASCSSIFCWLSHFL